MGWTGQQSMCQVVGAGVDDEIVSRGRAIDIEDAAADGALGAIATFVGTPCNEETAVGQCTDGGAKWLSSVVVLTSSSSPTKRTAIRFSPNKLV